MAQKSFLTTFEISQICEVNPTTVQNWVKENKLKAYSTPGGHRRILREDLISFMKEFGMPIPADLKDSSPMILIVDDEKEVIELLTSLFETAEEDLDVTGAQSGVEALLLIGAHRPDLLILDVMMPGMNGLEVCQRLKSAPSTRNLKIIAVSGDHNPSLRNRVLAAGADRFFTKPFDMMVFRDECIALLHSHEAR
jgi:excisionase family DNA binding protein